MSDGTRIRSSSRRRSSWIDEGVAHFLDLHPLADDRVTPLGAPLELILVIVDALDAQELPRLMALPELPAEAMAEPDSQAGALASMFVNYYSRCVARGVIVDPGELVIGLGGLTPERLESHESGFHEIVRLIGDVARRLQIARGALEQGQARLRGSHHRFFDIATSSRHAETARLHEIRQRAGRAPPENEQLRDTSARIERAFGLATGRMQQALREVDRAPSHLYDVERLHRLTHGSAQALEAVGSLRGEAEAAAGRTSSLPRLRRAIGDLRTAATFALRRAEEAHSACRLGEPLLSELRSRFDPEQ